MKYVFDEENQTQQCSLAVVVTLDKFIYGFQLLHNYNVKVEKPGAASDKCKLEQLGIEIVSFNRKRNCFEL